MEENEKIIQSITTVLNDLAVDDLNFLLNQTRILDHNRRVRLSQEEAAANSEDGSFENGKKSSPEAKTVVKESSVRIEQAEGSKFFNICIDGARLFVDLSEIQTIYKIASKAESVQDGAARLYRWFQKERSDILMEGNIKSAASSNIIKIYKVLLDTFTDGDE